MLIKDRQFEDTESNTNTKSAFKKTGNALCV